MVAIIIWSIILVSVSVILASVLWLTVWSGQSVYRFIRRRDARPLTDEEKWQETSTEPTFSEEEWARLLASITAFEEGRKTDKENWYMEEDEDHRL